MPSITYLFIVPLVIVIISLVIAKDIPFIEIFVIANVVLV